MKLPPKSKRENYWLTPKLGKAIKFSPLFLIPLSMQVLTAKPTEVVSLIEKNATTN